MIEFEFSLLCFMEVKWKARRQCVQKPARGPAEMLIVNKVLGFHNNPQVGRTAAPPANEPERERGQCTVHTHTPSRRVWEKDRRKENRRSSVFLQGSRPAPPNICYDINEVILSRRRSGGGGSEAAEGSPPSGGTLLSDGRPKCPHSNTQTRARPHGTGNKITMF